MIHVSLKILAIFYRHLKAIFARHTDYVPSIAFSPDGQYLACGRYNTIRLWNTQTGEYKNTLKADTGHTLSIAFSPDGTKIASGGEDGKVLL